MGPVSELVVPCELLWDILPIFDAYLEKQHSRTLPTQPLYLFAPACRSYISQLLKSRTKQDVADDVSDSLARILRFLESCISSRIPTNGHISKYPKLERLLENAKVHGLRTTRQRALELAQYVRVTRSHDLSLNGVAIRAFASYVEELQHNSPPTLDAPILPAHKSRGRFVSPGFHAFADNLYDVLVKSTQCNDSTLIQAAPEEPVHSINLCLYCAKMYDYSGDDVDLEVAIKNHHNEWRACRFTSVKRFLGSRDSVTQFCQILDSVPTSNTSMQFATDGCEIWRDRSPQEQHIDYLPEVPQSLHQYLDSGQWDLLLEAKRKLMVIIARAFAQLFGSKWMHGWTRRNLLLFPARDSYLPNVIYPFISMSGKQVNTATNTAVSSLLGSMLSGSNASLRQLGILLVEIERGSSISSKTGDHIPHQIMKDPAASDVLNAMLVYEEMKEKLYGPLRFVIELCLYSKDCPDKLKDPAGCDVEMIRTLIDTHIVEHLETDLKHVLYKQSLSTETDEIFRHDPNQFKIKTVMNDTKTNVTNSNYDELNLCSVQNPPMSYSHVATMEHASIFFDQKFFNKAETDVDSRFNAFKLRVTQRGLVKLTRRAPRLKIAVIDTFISRDKPNVRGIGSRLREVKRFYADSFRSEAENEDCLHGSNVISILHRVAPFADIYVAEVSKSSSDDLDDKILASALEHAADKDVPNGWCADIVIMSFGWDAETTSQKYPRFHRALEDIKAPFSRPLFFAAASNGGADLRRTYPARSDSVFAMHATNFTGDAPVPNFNPTRLDHSTNYSILGHEVPGYSDLVRVSGTSFAAPMAAGLAASVIEFCRQHGGQAYMLDYLCTYDGMKRVFDRMVIRRGDYDYLDWAQFFHPMCKDEEVYSKILSALGKSN